MNASEPLVSVVLPTFNRAAVLMRALNSVLSQSYPHLELLVVDDGSTDNTEAVVRQITDPRVRYLRQRNAGPGAARNAGIAAARGELIAFQDSDDEWLPDKLARQVALLKGDPSIGVALCGFREYRAEKTTELRVDEPMTRQDAGGSLVTGLWYVPPTWLIRKAALDAAGLFDEHLPSCEDWDLAFRLSDVCRFGCVAEILVQKFHSHGSVFDVPAGRVEGFRIILERHRSRWQRHRYWLARHEFVLGYWYLHELRRMRAGLWYFLLALMHHPASQWRKIGQQIPWALLSERIRRRLWRRRIVRRFFGEARGPASRKPVARLYTPIPIHPQFPNGFAERWFHFLRALQERFDVEVVAIRGLWNTSRLSDDDMRPPLELASFRVADVQRTLRGMGLPVSLLQQLLTQLNTRRYGPRIPDAERQGSPSPAVAVFFTHFVAHLAFRIPHETPCVFVLEEGLVRMQHINRPDPESGVQAKRLWRRWVQQLATRRYSRFVARCGRRGHVVAISDSERDWLSQWIPPERIRTINLSLEPSAYAPRDLTPDHDVAIFGDFEQVRNYAPAISLINRAQQRADTRHIRWLLVGRRPTKLLYALPRSRVTILADVPDTRDYYGRAHVVAVPTRIVTGSKTTLLKAWAMRRPVVASTESTAGIPARPGDNLLVGSTDDALLDAILRLLGDPALLDRVAAAGRLTIETERSQNDASREFLDYCSAVAGPVVLPART